MTGRRVLFLVVGLWTALAVAQSVATITATASLPLDGGAGPARAYVVTGGNPTGTEYGMVNAGQKIQVFNLATNAEVTGQGGIFSTFAVADFLTVGAGATTLVAAADVGPACASLTVCVDIFYWDPVGGFVIQASASTSVNNATAMAIDATSSPIRIFFATSSPTTALYEQDITINSSGVVTVSGVPTTLALPPALSGLTVEGLTVDGNSLVVYASDSASNLSTIPEDGGTPAVYAVQATGGYSQVVGLSFFPFPIPPSGVPATGVPFLLAGSGLPQGIYNINPNGDGGASIIIGSAIVFSADGGRKLSPTGASVDGYASLTLLTEDLDTANTGGVPWMHVIAGLNLFPDGGPPDGGADAGDGGTDAGPVADAGPDAGGIPTIPIIAPGPGALPGGTNSCNCSSAGSAPVLLVLLLPLLVPRRRR
jgi:hypothetical protein